MKSSHSSGPQPASHGARRAARRQVLAGIGALSVAGLAGCAAPAAITRPAAAAPQVRVGDSWRYRQVNGYNGLELGETMMRVVTVAPELRVAVSGWGAPEEGTEEIHAGPWNVLQEPAYDMLQRFETPQPLLPAQLQAGAKVRYSGRYRVPGFEESFDWHAWADALRWEAITVPAGRFEALRIQRRIAFRHSDLWRVQCERLETLWYAPEANRWVRREWTGTYRRYSVERKLLLREDWIVSELVEYASARG